MSDMFIIDIKNRMKNCLNSFQKNINNIRTGYISPKLLDNITIEYYGKRTLIRELSNIVVEKSNVLKITVFDNTIISSIEKSILNSKLDVNPLVKGNIIRIIIPSLTEERRIKLSKLVKSEAEISRVNIRNIRRDANDILKKSAKNKEINSDFEYITQRDIQELTDIYINKINDLLIKKQSEIINF